MEQFNPQLSYKAAYLAQVLDILEKNGFSSLEIDLIMSDLTKIPTMHKIFSQVPQALNNSDCPDLLKATIISYCKHETIYKKSYNVTEEMA